MSSDLLPSPPAGVRWSVCLRDAATSDVLAEHDPDRVQRTASVGKLFLLLEVARQLQDGILDPTERLTWEPGEWIADSGIWYLLDQADLTVVDLCRLVGAFSDNLATNVLLRRVTIPAVTATTAALGFTDSALLDRVRDDRGPADPPTLSRGTAAELSELMARLHRGEVCTPEVSARVRGWLAANADLSMVASALGLDPLAHTEPDRGVSLVNKTGTISTARIDVGTASGPLGAVSWAVLAEWDPGTDPREHVLATMAETGHRLARHIGAPSSAAQPSPEQPG